MSEVNLSQIATLVIVGFAGGASGYIFRRLQKFEDTKDELRVHVLPAIYTVTNLFLEIVGQFTKQNIDKDELQKKFDEIEESLKKQIFELGAVALLKESTKKDVFDFYLNFSLMSIGAKSLNETDLRKKFEEDGQRIGGVSNGELRKLAERVRLAVLNELKGYKIKLPLMLILILGVLGVLSAVITLLGK